jgi:hypothetical protein
MILNGGNTLNIVSDPNPFSGNAKGYTVVIYVEENIDIIF